MVMPVKVMYSGLTNTIYAVRRYSARPGGLFIAANGAKNDVTAEAVAAVIEHVRSDGGCSRTGCLCGMLEVHEAVSTA